MALYYNLVFGLLVFEMAFFTVLSLPLPRKIRKSVLQTISKPFQSEQFQIAIKCILGFISILFVDSVNRVASVSKELNSSHPANPASAGLSDRSEIQARRFYAQRNMYLCGFTLFLTLILTRTYSLVGELILTKDKLDSANLSKAKSGTTGQNNEILKLKAQLKSKNEDLEILQEQAASLSKDYDSVSETVAKPRKVKDPKA